MKIFERQQFKNAKQNKNEIIPPMNGGRRAAFDIYFI